MTGQVAAAIRIGRVLSIPSHPSAEAERGDEI